MDKPTTTRDAAATKEQVDDLTQEAALWRLEDEPHCHISESSDSHAVEISTESEVEASENDNPTSSKEENNQPQQQHSDSPSSDEVDDDSPNEPGDVEGDVTTLTEDGEDGSSNLNTISYRASSKSPPELGPSNNDETSLEIIKDFVDGQCDEGTTLLRLSTEWARTELWPTIIDMACKRPGNQEQLISLGKAMLDTVDVEDGFAERDEISLNLTIARRQAWMVCSK
jgi:hypothetical protein